MGLINLYRKKNRKLLFTTPSHGQKFFIFNKFRQFYKYDISETDAHNPQAALWESEEQASNIYKTKHTSFLSNGSTSGIIAAVMTCAEKDDNILICSDAHHCHANAVKLSGGNPIFYDIPLNKEWGVPERTTAELLEKHFKSNKIKAVIVTSPTYEGFVSDINSIQSVCSKYGAYLIVDEAHGALYPFCDKLPQSAVNIADFTVQSLHKTAGGLNPTALLHTNTDLNLRKALDTINTTSPSYPLLTSIEANINYLNSQKGRSKINELVIEAIKIRQNSYEHIVFGGDDPLKLLIKQSNMSGSELSEKLFNEFDIEDEKINEISTMLLCGLGTTKKQLEKLSSALNKV